MAGVGSAVGADGWAVWSAGVWLGGSELWAKATGISTTEHSKVLMI
jgi:hypothetical protein